MCCECEEHPGTEHCPSKKRCNPQESKIFLCTCMYNYLLRFLYGLSGEIGPVTYSHLYDPIEHPDLFVMCLLLVVLERASVLMFHVLLSIVL